MQAAGRTPAAPGQWPVRVQGQRGGTGVLKRARACACMLAFIEWQVLSLGGGWCARCGGAWRPRVQARGCWLCAHQGSALQAPLTCPWPCSLAAAATWPPSRGCFGCSPGLPPLLRLTGLLRLLLRLGVGRRRRRCEGKEGRGSPAPLRPGRQAVNGCQGRSLISPACEQQCLLPGPTHLLPIRNALPQGKLSLVQGVGRVQVPQLLRHLRMTRCVCVGGGGWRAGGGGGEEGPAATKLCGHAE